MTNWTRESALRFAITRAVLAPSVHNTQPWRFTIAPNGLEISADRSRQLQVLDPTGRQLLLSAGCALLNARVSLAASGFSTQVVRFPDRARPDLLARIDVFTSGQPDDALALLEPAVIARQTNRRRFDATEVPAELVATLFDAAAMEHAVLHPVVKPDDRQTLARLSQHADAQQLVDGGYRAELRAWTTDDAGRRDGVRSEAVPHVDGHAHDELPIRDFDTRGTGALPADTRSSSQQCLFVLGTTGDSSESWLRAGEALERIWLELTRAGFVASVFTQVIEQAGIRASLRHELRLSIHPHIVLRVGRAPVTSASRRRPVASMLDHAPA